MSPLAIKTAKIGSFFGVAAAVHSTSSYSGLENLLLVGGFVTAAAIWVLLQVRDYKPNRRLRGDNSELRTENDDLRRLLDESEARERKLEKSRDFDTSLAVVMKEITEARSQAASEHRAILEEIQQSRTHQYEAWATFHQQMGALTSAIQVVASGMLGDVAPPVPK